MLFLSATFTKSMRNVRYRISPPKLPRISQKCSYEGRDEHDEEDAAEKSKVTAAEIAIRTALKTLYC